MKNDLAPEELTEKAAAFALGALDPVEVGSFAQVVAEDPDVAAELHAFRKVVDALAFDTPLSDPPSALRGQLLANLGEQDAWVAPEAAPVTDRRLVRAGEGNWVQAEPGVQIKVLYQDESRHTMTTLVRMEAGARIPRHYHDGAEECYVISGDIYDDHVTMKAGDYVSLMRDTMHSFVSTINGALLLIISPLGHDGTAAV